MDLDVFRVGHIIILITEELALIVDLVVLFVILIQIIVLFVIHVKQDID